ncbi:MBL fold metallo-hydrolase [Immundisolibacter sp.]
MIQKGLMVGLLEVNCYIIGDEETKEAVVIDPGGDEDEILEALKYHNFKLKYIIDTHGHFDHVDANQPLKDATGAQILIHPLDAAMLQRDNEAMFFTGKRMRPSKADVLVKEGDVITFGNIKLNVLHTPGHTPGGISLVNADSPLVYVGDTLFAGSIGRTDLPRGNHADLLRAIPEQLWPLGNDVRFIPGHGPMSTFGAERRSNPYVADSVLARG